jgi:hypothetical protein
MTLDHRMEIVEGAARPLLRKWALTPAGSLALKREAERLERARHPGVVVLAGVAEDHIDVEWAGAETLALARLTRSATARILTVLASTVADLHDLGIVHGRIDETHVVIGPESQPRLCGLRGPEPGRPEPGPADDVADLGLLMQRAIGMGADHDLVPERRWRTWPRSGGRDRALEAICERASDPDPARRPTARALARSLADLVPDVALERSLPATESTTEPTLAARPEPLPERRTGPEPESGEHPDPGADAGNLAAPSDLPHPPPARATGARLMTKGSDLAPGRPAARTTPGGPSTAAPAPGQRTELARRPEAAGRRPVLGRAALAFGLIALAGAALTLRQPSSGATDPSTATAFHATSLATAASAVSAAPSTLASSQPPAANGVPPSPAVGNGTVELDGATYEVGQAGDHLAVADWDCDGAVTVGLVRPSTGEVFLFDTWPDAGPVSIRARARIPGAQQLVGTPPGADCRSPQVRLLDGSSVVLAVDAGR